ncbi:hypothetical protein [Maridesulfovibrio zosterae]|uniref:hypothetical protein n=1 Tax=Maridesulfovibrio zosterae TaxID=82171 RepID=UPI0003F7A970|nr:hypothetical protein [Maridesulfovibrio zosterae]
MNGHNRHNLMFRLNNCLETILDLEPQLKKLDLSRNFIDELEVLKGFMSKLKKVKLSEDEVERIESATDNFLQELKFPLGQADTSRKMFMRLQ